ncbi:MAG: thiamine phosphate synthase [Alphaproteobacteria bacterium]|nr:thiamine phosphate synthase [Alphaproteobacteria bacterium]MDX5369340.1 thiamine phosphate synthase [Alphaproteobacteria bacterium]MDX5464021.1 thiamine phosphate synthase [Alphaproteobacteria bacterium]
MTDPVRLPDARPYLSALPPGSLVIERSYGEADRAGRVTRLVEAAHARGIRVLVAGDPGLARAVRADGVHLPQGLARSLPRAATGGLGLVTMAAHSADAILAARRLQVDAVFLSPVFPTLSHPGAPALGLHRFARLAAAFPCPVIALGGMTGRRWRRISPLPGVIGWAGIGFVAADA